MIYNYRNPRATPTEGREEAFIYRSDGPDNLAAESNILFKFGEGLSRFTELQTKYRTQSLIKVLEKYEERHFDCCQEFKDVVVDGRPQIEKIKQKLAGNAPLALGDSQDILKVRLEYESILHWYFKPKFDFLHRLLEAFSVEVQFFDDPNKDLIRKVYPFDKARTVTALRKTVEKVIKKRKDRIDALNAELRLLLSQEEDVKVATSDKIDDQKAYDVFISYRWTSPDQEWVQDQLHPRLVEAGVKVILDVEDFVFGRDLILEMERAGNESRHVLCVISPEYFEEDRMVEFESLSARRRDPGGRNSFLIPLILRKADIPDRIRGLIPMDWTNPKNHARNWKKLLELLKAPKRKVQPPGRV